VARPDANVGLATGRGVFVVDIDGPKGEQALIDYQKARGILPDTAHQATGSAKGRQLVFRGNGVRNKQKWLPGVDIRGENGLAVMPASVHASGGRYRWIERPEHVGVAEAPSWLLEDLTGDVKPARPPRSAATAAAAPKTDEKTSQAVAALGGTIRHWRPKGDLIGSPTAEGLGRDAAKIFPINGTGQRFDQGSKVACRYLCLGKGPELVYAIGFYYLWHYHEKGLIATPFPEALDLLAESIRAAVAKLDAGELQYNTEEDRSLEAAGLELTPWEEILADAALSLEDGELSLVLPTASPLPPLNPVEENKGAGPGARGHTARGHTGMPLCRTVTE
jgi:hypothetical protein